MYIYNGSTGLEAMSHHAMKTTDIAKSLLKTFKQA